MAWILAHKLLVGGWSIAAISEIAAFFPKVRGICVIVVKIISDLTGAKSA